MGPTATLRLRRSAAQLHALAGLEREIRATDPHTRRKYLRDFASAFRSYEAVLQSQQLAAAYHAADVLLVGDYHALPRSQKFTAELLAEVAREKPVVLGLEMLFSRDQNLVDDWRQGDIDEQELRERIRFDLEWGYDWRPFYDLLQTARTHATAIYGLDCMPRNDLRRIALRDRHAAAKIAEIRERHPEAALVVLFGESHLAPNHLPELVSMRRPQDRLLTVLQNVDSLYWLAAGEFCEHVEAVRVRHDVLCVFNSTPLEKYESYRLCLERWRQEGTTTPDLAPSFYNLVDALLQFLNIDKYSASNGTQPRFLVDELPEICFRPSDERVRRLLLRKGADETEIDAVVARLADYGCCYVPRLRSVLVRDFQFSYAAEEASRFVHQVCRAAATCAALPDPTLTPEDRFYTHVLQWALGFFGSRALCPARRPVREYDLYALYSLPREAVDELEICSYHEFMQLVDILVLHKDYEANLQAYRERPPMLAECLRLEGKKFLYTARQLGYMLGSELYNAYISGRIAKRFLRSLYFRHLDKPGAARTAYFAIQRKLGRRRPAA